MPSIIPLINAEIIKIKNKNTNHPKAIDIHSQINILSPFWATKKRLDYYLSAR
jgi:hypothetical protein